MPTAAPAPSAIVLFNAAAHAPRNTFLEEETPVAFGPHRSVTFAQLPDGPLGGVVWPAARLWVANISASAKTWRGLRVLELGCGTGAVGLALAAAGARVTAGDGDATLVDLAARNAAAARLPLTAVHHKWGTGAEDQLFAQHGPWDAVVACDVVYGSDARALLKTIGSLARLGVPAFHIVHQDRQDAQERRFFHLVTRKCALEIQSTSTIGQSTSLLVLRPRQ